MGRIYLSYRGHGVRYIIRVFTNKLIEVDYRSARVSATTKIFVDIPSLLKKSNIAKYPYLSIVRVSEIRPPTRKIVPRNFPSSLEFTRIPGNDNDSYLHVRQSYEIHRNRSKFWEKTIQLSRFYWSSFQVFGWFECPGWEQITLIVNFSLTHYSWL